MDSKQNLQQIETFYNNQNKKIIDLCFKSIYGCSFNDFKINKKETYREVEEKIKQLEHEITELRDNYWDKHKILVKNGLN